MIRNRTVFILGAGASYPYGFPTGEGLVNEIISLTRTNTPHTVFSSNGCSAEEVLRFSHDLSDSELSSVDSFLEYRPDFLMLGKLAICLALIPKEKDYVLSREYRQTNNSGCWYHYLWRQMSTSKGRFGDNHVSFVTFNYDRSLERYFFLRLRAQHPYKSDDEVLDELYKLRFVHVYGSLGDPRFEEDSYDRPTPSPREVMRAANRLRIIHEEMAAANYLSNAIQLLKDAQVLCFLGYGYHQLNNGRLRLHELAEEDRTSSRGPRKRKWFTTRLGVTDVEFRRQTSGFYNRFTQDDLGYATNDQLGWETQNALDLLRLKPVIQ
jgi:hypothetical protein